MDLIGELKLREMGLLLMVLRDERLMDHLKIRELEPRRREVGPKGRKIRDDQ